MTPSSRCVFCNSTAYGKGCKYGVKGIHFHPDDPKKCSYCGSTAYGKGCTYNPNDNVHVHGISYNSMLKDKMEQTFLNQMLLKELKKPFTEFKSFEMGLTDAAGNKIKEPVTEEEQSAISPYTRTLLKIKKYLGPKLELIDSLGYMERAKVLESSTQKHEQLVAFESKMNDVFAQFHEIVDQALAEGLAYEDIEAIIQ